MWYLLTTSCLENASFLLCFGHYIIKTWHFFLCLQGLPVQQVCTWRPEPCLNYLMLCND